MNKNISKKYLVSVSALLVLGYGVSFIILYYISKNAAGAALYSVIAALIPCATYTGAVFFGLRLIKKEKLSRKVIIAVCIFFPLTLAFITVSGIILIIPLIIKSVLTLLKK